MPARSDTPAPLWRDLAPRVHARGWGILALKPGTKAPGAGWRTWTPGLDDFLDLAETQAGIGLRLGPQRSSQDAAPFVVAVDVDVRDVDVADALDVLAVDMLGRGPLRVGAAPKRARLYRLPAGEATGKLRSPGFALPGDAATDKPHAVEVLAEGQQIVAWGTHPDTGRPYTWPEGASPETLRPDELPVVTRAQLGAFIEAAGARLAQAGGVQKTSGSNGATAAVGHTSSALGLAALDPDLAEDAARAIDASGMDYDAWINLGHAIKGAFQQDDGRGLEVWLHVSTHSARHDGDVGNVIAKWHSFGVGGLRSGAGTIYRLAYAQGWHPPAGYDFRDRLQPAEPPLPPLPPHDLAALDAELDALWTTL